MWRTLWLSSLITVAGYYFFCTIRNQHVNNSIPCLHCANRLWLSVIWSRHFGNFAAKSCWCALSSVVRGCNRSNRIWSSGVGARMKTHPQKLISRKFGHTPLFPIEWHKFLKKTSFSVRGIWWWLTNCYRKFFRRKFACSYQGCGVGVEENVNDSDFGQTFCSPIVTVCATNMRERHTWQFKQLDASTRDDHGYSDRRQRTRTNLHTFTQGPFQISSFPWAHHATYTLWMQPFGACITEISICSFWVALSLLRDVGYATMNESSKGRKLSPRLKMRSNGAHL